MICLLIRDIRVFIEGDARESSGMATRGPSTSSSKVDGEGFVEDPYTVDDVEPMSKTQRIVILLVIAGVIFLALYLLRYWGIF